MTSNCNTIVRRDITRDDLRPGLVVYDKITGERKTIRYVTDAIVRYMDNRFDYINGNYSLLKLYEVEVSAPSGDEVDQLIESRSNGTYTQISNDASKIIDTLGTGDNFAYFYSQIANKLARIKHGYSVEDSLLDIAGYAKLELEKLRGCE